MDLSISTNWPVVATAGGARSLLILNTGFDRAAVGDVAPVFDTLYRVTDLRESPHPFIRMERLADKKLEKEVGLRDDGFAVAFGQTAQVLLSYGHGDDFSYFTVQKPSSQTDAAPNPVVRIHRVNTVGAGPRTPGPRSSRAEEKDIEARAGVILPLVQGYEFEVVKIVLPDENRHILGWAEFQARRRADAVPSTQNKSGK